MKTAVAVVVFAARIAWRLAVIAAKGLALMCLLALAIAAAGE